MALTLPSLIGKYQKKVTVERLKKSYSLLYQALEMSTNEHETINYWNFDLNTQEFMDIYLIPYLKKITSKEKENEYSSDTYKLADGTTIKGWMYKNPAHKDVTTFFQITIDINDEKKPNQLGRDKFIYYIFPTKRHLFNAGEGDVARNVPGPGLYPDGYGYDRETLKNNGWRGCNKNKQDESPGGNSSTQWAGAFCTALIMLDGWDIADDYKW